VTGDAATRFEWKQPYTQPPGLLVLQTRGLTLSRGDDVQHVSLAEFAAGALNDEVLAAFDFRTLVEVLALALPSSVALLERGVPAAHVGRPSVPRVFGGGRGAAWVVFILGRRVSGRALDQPFDLGFDDLLQHGLPAEVAACLGEEQVTTITHAVQQLTPLPCMCDTDCETQDQHGRTTSLLRRDHPHANVEFHVNVSQCDVCGSLWSWEVTGDSHYSYQCDARRIISASR
jgi:hypothetical protein